jgi:sugar (pentulose or hexulose) kinase
VRCSAAGARISGWNEPGRDRQEIAVTPTASATILAVDLGTQSLRVSAVAADGATLWRWSKPVTSFIDGARNEQDPAEWSALVEEALAEAGRAGVRPAAVAAAGPLAGWVPMSGDRPLGPATMYFDTRAAEDTARLAEILAERPEAPRPTVADPLPQLLRLRRERPGIAGAMDRLLDATGFLVQRLCGEAVLDPYTAIRLYGSQMTGRLGIDTAVFGRPSPLGERVGVLTPRYAAHLGGSAIPVISATFDSKCAYIASGITGAGEALDISGTVTSFGIASPRRLIDPGKRVYSVPLDDVWLVRGSMGGTGSVLEWARAELFGQGFAAMEASIAAIPPGAAGVTFLPFHSGARAPLWNPHARGAFLGLGLDASRSAMARAIYEGLCFGLRHITETMAEGGVAARDIRLAGGLARSDLLSQMKADVLGCPALRLADHELTTAGLVVIAAAALGLYPDRRTASRAIVAVADRFSPSPDRARYDEPYRRYRAAVDTLSPTFVAPL